MKNFFGLSQTIYYYLNLSYKIWKVRRLQEDDLVYKTRKNVRFEVYPGSKQQSPYDFIVRFREPGKRQRTPAHVHLIVEMYVKHAYNPSLTMKLRDHILTMLGQIRPTTLQQHSRHLFSFLSLKTLNPSRCWIKLVNSQLNFCLLQLNL